MADENQHLKNNVKEIGQRNDALCERIRELSGQSTDANCLLEGLEKLLRQKEKDVQLKMAEAARIARLIQEQKDSSEKWESDRKELELRFQHLQKDLEDLLEGKVWTPV
ncbi:uncharacterized protein LOC135214205 [Macrobrachium nipponense]|uniref:uncharacterized protein LOC135214205 n=1 Tax=Macrobrachium nipponense TaxID=159736 RepID=UPI0030C87F0C